MKGPFAEWVRWRVSGEVGSGTVVWTTGDHPTLGPSIFHYCGAGALSVFERGVAYPDGRVAIAYDEVLEVEPLWLAEVMRASKNVWDAVELRLRASSGPTVLMLPFVQYTSLLDILTEYARRERLRSRTS